jgi:hypothetical protein
MNVSMRLALIGLAFVALLPACDSTGHTPAGEEDASGSENRLSPSVVAVEPSVDSINISRSAVVTVAFSEPILRSTLTDDSFTLRDESGIVSTTVGYDRASKTATLETLQPLDLLTQYTVELTTGITDQSGNTLAAVLDWQFTTADGSWSSPVRISDGPEHWLHTAAIDSNGNILVVWGGLADGAQSIWANRYSADVGWGTATVIAADVADYIDHPIGLAVDPQGNATITWSGKVDDKHSIFGQRYTNGVGWELPTIIASSDISSDYRQGNIDVVVDRYGDVTAMWTFSGRLFSRRYISGQGWEDAAALVGQGYHAEMAVGETGQVFALWSSFNTIWIKRLLPEAGWGTAEPWHRNSDAIDSVSLALLGEGDVRVLWLEQDYHSGYAIHYGRYVADSGWSDDQILVQSAYWLSAVNFVVGSSGSAVVLWNQLNDSGGQKLLAKHYQAVSGWGDALVVGPERSDNYSGTSVGIDGKDRVVAVWSHYGIDINNNASDYLWSNRYTPGSGWERTERLTMNEAGGELAPRVLVHTDGVVTIIWSSLWDGVNRALAERRFE